MLIPYQCGTPTAEQSGIIPTLLVDHIHFDVYIVFLAVELNCREEEVRLRCVVCLNAILDLVIQFRRHPEDFSNCDLVLCSLALGRRQVMESYASVSLIEQETQGGPKDAGVAHVAIPRYLLQ